MNTYKKVNIPHYDTIVEELKEYTKVTHPYLYSGISWTGKKMHRAAGKNAQKLFERAMIEEKIKNEIAFIENPDLNFNTNEICAWFKTFDLITFKSFNKNVGA